ncbi:hypothetical protein Esi_0596_0002 [Ectocarpus siliculosus]|uniref:Uncharacterized protein n=1 Tax=Ectocarpus siliculosus TaxID=2880 RepID=D7G505_ECTSI|nr:hypothetical protein Esi_0596_0002 [Ectocarpus siliculosus]|eukprot:CBJ33768.1 hypothetical protein Esi_0596_0002 [Ectocarpus siliculosus]
MEIGPDSGLELPARGHEAIKRAWMPKGHVLDLSKDHVEREEGAQAALRIDLDGLRTGCDLTEAGEVITGGDYGAVVSLLKRPLPSERIASGKYRLLVPGEDARVKAQHITNFQIGFGHGSPSLGEVKMFIMLTYRRDPNDSPDGRTVARRATIPDVDVYQEALSRTLIALSKREGFRAVFVGPTHTTQQLRLASHKEVIYLPPEADARTSFFKKLNRELVRGFGLEFRPDAQPFMIVLKAFNQKHALWAPLTEPGEEVMQTVLADNMVAFASTAFTEVSTVFNADRFGSEISVDLAVTMSRAQGSDDVLLAPRGDYYAAGGGASGRSGVGYEGGRGTDLGFDVTKYSLFGSDQCASISGQAYGKPSLPAVARHSILDDASNALTSADAQLAGVISRTNLNVYSPTVLHATNSSKGHAMAVALRGSRVSNAVELLRGVGVSGAFLSDARVGEAHAAVAKGREAALAIISGMKGANGSLRTEVTYLLESDGADDGAAQGFERMCADLLGEVFGVQVGGWNDIDATFALPTEVVVCLMHALCVRSLESIKFGFNTLADLGDPRCDDVIPGQLPIGHLPSVGESVLRMDGLSLRIAGGVGSALRAGQASCGFLALRDDASWIMKEGGATRLPIGLLIRGGGGLRSGGFGPRSRAFLVSQTHVMPAKTRGLDLLLHGGERLLELLRSVFHHVMEEARVASVKKNLLSSHDGDAEGDAEDDIASTWCPGPAALLARNEVLAQDPDMAGKRFEVPDSHAKSVPVSTCLGRLLPTLDGKSLGEMPAPHTTVFNAIVQAFCAAPAFALLAPAVARMWLLVLLEALVVEDIGMCILPKTRASRIFTIVGHFVRS